MEHIPVLKNEVLEVLSPKPNENFIDATFGGGGHSLLLLEKNKPKGKVLGIEADPVVYKEQKEKFGNYKKLLLANDSYLNIDKIAEKYEFSPVNGILFDLGISSWHIDESGRGFSFKKNEPLDMRFEPDKNDLTAAEIINSWPIGRIAEILWRYGEEKFSRRIAKKIGERRKERKILTTEELSKIVGDAVPAFYKRKKIHFATKTFQALRIAVNNELEGIMEGLPKALKILSPGGRLAVISFHSLEDRIVKHTFRRWQDEGKAKIITKKPIKPAEEEIKNNPKSRSAKLRGIIKLKAN